MARPTKPPTPGEYKVIAFILIAFAIGLGLVCLYYGFTKSGKNPEAAETLKTGGSMLLAAGILGPIIGSYLVRHFID